MNLSLTELYAKLEAKVGQKGLWLILAIVCMLVVMKVCF